jgi:hypothetical protein
MTLPLVFRVTDGNSTHHKPLPRSKRETEGFMATLALLLVFRVTDGNFTHHRPLPRLKRKMEGFHGNNNTKRNMATRVGIQEQ